MKHTLKFYTIIIGILLSASSSYAQNSKTFYVCSGTSFTLNPQVTTFSDYEWRDLANPANPISLLANLAQTSPVISNATYQVKQYALRVKSGTTGCWSDPDTFTVYTLPPVNVAITGADTAGYCSHNSTSDTLKANVAALTLPTGVAADQFAWTLNSSAVGTNSPQLVITTASIAGTSVYGVTASYSLPAVIGGAKLGTCVGTNSVSITVNNVPTAPAISIL